MKYIKRLTITLLIFCVCLSAAVTLTPVGLFSANASAYLSVKSGDEVYVGGQTIGINFNIGNVQIVCICDAYSESGLVSPAKNSGLCVGDIILSYNNVNVTNITELDKMLGNYKDAEANLRILRGEKTINVKLKPVLDVISKKYKLGALVRDSVSGIGTVTYVKVTSGEFGSLGHPVYNGKNELMELKNGNVYPCSIIGAVKGERGRAGELKGIFINDKIIGNSIKNTQTGIYGVLNENANLSNAPKCEMGSVANASIGKAKIYSTINGVDVEAYDINIVKVDKNDKNNKNYVIKITDKRLLEATGGIVQGMSGSPIIQNGSLIGAVTHVFLNDSTRGYGIAIDEMANAS